MMKVFRSKKGFTLAEIAIVAGVIALLTVIAIPSFIRARESARRWVCIGNQRTIFSAAMLYEVNESSSLGNVGGQKARLDELISKGYIKDTTGYECPSSDTVDYDDYIFIFRDGELVDIQCQIKPAEHVWPEE